MKALDEAIYVVMKSRYSDEIDKRSSRPTGAKVIEILPGTKDRKPLRIGESVKVYKNGSTSGTAIIRSIEDHHCDAKAGIVDPKSDLKLRFDEFALATNSKQVQSHKRDRQNLSGKEKDEILKLVIGAYNKEGIRVKDAKAIQTPLMILIATGEKTPKAAVIKAEVKQGEPTHNLLLVAERENGSFRNVLSLFKTSGIGESSGNYEFVDQLDIDGNGTNELVIESTGYESQGFWIYRRDDQQWKRVATGGEAGC